jgi:hypothetical protein
LLPTPDASVANYAEDPDKWQARADLLKVKHGNGNGTPLAVAVKMLPTPRSSDMNGAGVHGQGGMDLRTAMQLLPTPTARGVKDTGAPAEFDRKSPELLPTTLKLLPTPRADPRDATARTPRDDWRPSLMEAVGSQSSGVTTSPPSADGKPSTGLRLNPSFVGWMMGTPSCSECGREWTDPDCPHSATAFTSTSAGSSGTR